MCHEGKCVGIKPYIYFSFLYSIKSQPLVKVKVNGIDYIISRAIYETSSFFEDYRKNNEGISEVASSEENIWKASIDELISLCYMASSFGTERCDQNDGNYILYFDESLKRWIFKTKIFLIEINKRGIVIQSKIFQGGKYIPLAGQASGEK